MKHIVYNINIIINSRIKCEIENACRHIKKKK